MQELIDRDDIIYTPHTAFYTETAVKNLVEGALNAAVDVITTGDSPNIVNRQPFNIIKQEGKLQKSNSKDFE